MDISNKILGFFSSYKKLTFQPGQLLIDAQSHDFPIYYIVKGNVKQSLFTIDGNTITLHVFREQAFIPTMLILADAENQYTFEAIDMVEVYAAPKDHVITFLKENPDVLFDLSTRLSQGIVGMLKKVESLMYTNVEHKLLSLLLYLCDHFGEKDTEKTYITLPLTHEDLASWIGSQRETISRQLEKLKKDGLVSYTKNKITIEKPSDLAGLLNKD